MLEKIGVMVVTLGVMSADSEILLIPLGIVLLGAFLIVLGTEVKEK